MLESINLIYNQVIEAFAEGGVKNVIYRRVFWNRIATPAQMDLVTYKAQADSHSPRSDFHFAEVKWNDIQSGKWSFALSGRGLKARRNLKRGFRCFAVTEGSIIVGDVWCLSPQNDGKAIIHPDLDMLNIQPEIGDAYAFDMLITPNYRGKNLAMPLQRFLHTSLKMEGCQNVYGYYWDDNLPALWMHRMLKYRELPKRSISRFFFIVRSKPTV